MRQARGCYTEPQTRFEFEGQRLSRCPVRLVSRTTWEFIALYQHYRKGFLLTDGGLLRQPYKYLQAMQVIGGELEKYLRERAAGGGDL
jgi:hypothetical protein